MCVHYKLHQKTLKADLTQEQRSAVDAGFRARVAELVVQRAKDDSNVGIKEAVADPGGSVPLEGDDSFSGDEEGGEEEEEGGSDAGDEEGSEEDDDDEDGSDGDENEDASEVGENDLPSTSVYG